MSKHFGHYAEFSKFQPRQPQENVAVLWVIYVNYSRILTRPPFPLPSFLPQRVKNHTKPNKAKNTRQWGGIGRVCAKFQDSTAAGRRLGRQRGEKQQRQKCSRKSAYSKLVLRKHNEDNGRWVSHCQRRYSQLLQGNNFINMNTQLYYTSVHSHTPQEHFCT